MKSAETIQKSWQVKKEHSYNFTHFFLFICQLRDKWGKTFKIVNQITFLLLANETIISGTLPQLSHLSLAFFI